MASGGDESTGGPVDDLTKGGRSDRLTAVLAGTDGRGNDASDAGQSEGSTSGGSSSGGSSSGGSSEEERSGENHSDGGSSREGSSSKSSRSESQDGASASQGRSGSESNGGTTSEETSQDPDAGDAASASERSGPSSEGEGAGGDSDVIEIDEKVLAESGAFPDGLPDGELSMEDLTDEQYKVITGEERGASGPWHKTPAGSVYESAESAREGLDAKDDYIQDLEKRAEEAESTRDEASEQLAFYQEFVPGEDIKEALVEQELPEEYRGLDPDDISDDEMKTALKDARWEAEKVVEERIEAEQEKQRKREEEQKERQENAQRFAEKRLTPKAFEVENPEKQRELEELFSEEQRGGRTLRDVVALAHNAFGEKAAARLVRGVKEEFWDSEQEDVDRRIRRIRVKPAARPTERAPDPEPEDKEPKTRRERAASMF